MLYAPGNRAELFDKALASGADSVILDLEDAVPHLEKGAAREHVADLLDRWQRRSPPVFVRINGTGTGLAGPDLVSVVRPGLAGIKLPKVEEATDIQFVDAEVSKLEAERGMTRGSVQLIASIESARGVLNAQSIARASQRIWCLGFGAGDYSRDTGSEETAEAIETLYARSYLVAISRDAGLAPPFDSVFPKIRQVDELLANARASKSLGFQGKAVIHPRQIEPVHSVYTPTQAELIRAQEVVAAFRDASSRGAGALQIDGVLVDLAHERRARDLIARASEMGLIEGAEDGL